MLSIMFFAPQINYYLSLLLSQFEIPTLTQYVYFVLYALGVMSYFMALKHVNVIFSAGILILLLLLSYAFDNSLSQYMFSGSLFSSPVPVLLFIYFPVFLLFLNKLDFPLLMRLLYFFSIITLLIAVSVLGVYVFIIRSMPVDYMSFAYLILTPTFVCFIWGLNGALFSFILSLLGGFSIFIVGCRGALVALIAFLVLSSLYSFISKKGKIDRRVKGFILFVAFILILLSFHNMLSSLSDNLGSLDLQSRTVERLLLGSSDFLQRESRQDLWKQAIDNTGFFMGKGLFADRNVLLDFNGQSAYTHNFFLEVLLEFGFVFGFIILILFLSTIIKSVIIARKSKDYFMVEMSFAMLSVFLIKHMLSSSYLISTDFWFYLGFAVQIVTNKDVYLNTSLNKIEEQKTEEMPVLT